MVNKWLLVDPPLSPKIMYISWLNPYDNSTLERQGWMDGVHHKVLLKFNKKIQQGNKKMYVLYNTLD